MPGLIALLVTAGSTILRTVLTAALVKILLAGVILLLVKQFVPFLVTLLPKGDFGIGQSMAAFTPAMWYFYDYFQVGYGLSLILTSMLTRFIIRRIPLFG